MRLPQGMTSAAQDFSRTIADLAASLPNRPPIKAITDALGGRAGDLGATGKKLTDSVRTLIGAPAQAAGAAFDEFNGRLEGLLEGAR